MPRPPRILFEGAVYHVFQRGNNHDFILKNPSHKDFFIKQLREYNRKFDYQILAYVIMDNHHHLLVRTNKDSINTIMFNINNVMAKFLSRELNRSGHIYESRYNCKVVENDAYLLWLLRYIHRNPVRAEIVTSVKDFKWSSDFYYRNNISDFINIDFIFNIISSNRIQARNQYLNLMAASGADDNSKLDYELIKEAFNLAETLNYEKLPKDAISSRLTLDNIFDSIEASQNFKELIKQGNRDKNITPYKIEFIKNALYNKYTLSEIGQFLNTNPDAIRKFKDYHKIV